MNSIDKAVAEITARTNEIKAGMESRGNLAAQLRESLREGRAATRTRTAETQAAALEEREAPVLAEIVREGARITPSMTEDPITGEPFAADLDLSGLADDALADLEDAATREGLAVRALDSARENLAAARDALAEAQDRVAAAEQELAVRQNTADVAQDFMTGTIRAWGLIRTETGFARRSM